METINTRTEKISRFRSIKNNSRMGNETRIKVESYIKEWEEKCYSKGIPDEAPIELGEKVPSYKRICLAILQNDMNLKSLGFKPKPSIYYSMLKRIEIDARPKKHGQQLKLKL